MSEREELEAVIARAVQSTHGTPADIATALINSGYTKGNGELVEAVRVWAEVAAQNETEAQRQEDQLLEAWNRRKAPPQGRCFNPTQEDNSHE